MKLIQNKQLLSSTSASKGLSWSSNGSNLALATEKAIIVYSLMPNSSNSSEELSLHQRELIITDKSESNPYLFNVGVDKESLISREYEPSLKRARLIRLETFTSASGEEFPRRVDVLGWSPDHQLCTLTSDHWLKLHHQSNEDFIDASESLHLYLKSKRWKLLNENKSESSEDDCDLLERRLLAQSITDFAWTDQGDLVAITKSGHLIIWTMIENTLKVQCFKNLETRDLCLIRPFKDFIFIGSNDGRCKVCYYNSSKVECVDLGYLWPESDMTRVTTIKVLGAIRSSHVEVKVILGKGPYLINFDLKLDKTSMKIVSQDHALIPNACKVVNIIEMPNKGSFLAVPDTGNPLEINFSNNSVTFKRLKTFELDCDRWLCTGCEISPCGGLMAHFQTVGDYHDHLILRTPSKISFFSLQDEIGLINALSQRRDLNCFPSLEALRVSCRISAVCRLNIPNKILDLRVKFWLSKLNDYLNADGEISQLSLNILKQIIQKRNPSALQMYSNANNKEEAWKCRFCGQIEDEEEKTLLSGTCKSGHKWPRCITSLDLVDRHPVFRCTMCQLLSLCGDNVCPTCGNELVTNCE